MHRNTALISRHSFQDSLNRLRLPVEAPIKYQCWLVLCYQSYHPLHNVFYVLSFHIFSKGHIATTHSRFSNMLLHRCPNNCLINVPMPLTPYLIVPSINDFGTELDTLRSITIGRSYTKGLLSFYCFGNVCQQNIS